MNWHTRYRQQANWTRDLREYLFDKTGFHEAQRVLEAGCGTGAILMDLSTSASLHGLDLDPAALNECRIHAPHTCLTRGDALALPYANETFDIVFCHFLLLWIREPFQAVREMKRVTRRSGYILALAEPDYTARVDKPESLAQLGQWQTEALRRRGADPSFGSRLAETFDRAGIELIETGPIRSQEVRRSVDEQKKEWGVLEADLAGFIPDAEIRKLKLINEDAWKRNERVLHVPTFFAWGKA